YFERIGIAARLLFIRTPLTAGALVRRFFRDQRPQDDLVRPQFRPVQVDLAVALARSRFELLDVALWSGSGSHGYVSTICRLRLRQNPGETASGNELLPVSLPQFFESCFR